MSVKNQFITFTYPAGPKDVIVTGDFCKWQKTTHLVPQHDGSFSLTMPLAYKSIKKEDDGDYFYFKFVVDDKWTIDSRFGSKVPQGSRIEAPNNFVKIDENSKRLSSFIPESALPSSQGSSGKRKVKVKRRMRKNKKTGETSIVSEDQEFVNQENQEVDTSSFTSPSVTPAPESNINTIVVPTTDEAKDAFTKFENNEPAKNAELEEKNIEDVKPSLSVAGEPGVYVADPSLPVFNETPQGKVEPKEQPKQEPAEEIIEEETQFVIQPVEQPKTKLTLAGEPGVQIADKTNPVFNEVRDVDQKQLNETLNAQLAEEQKAAAEETAIEPKEEENVVTQAQDDKPEEVVSKPKQAPKETAQVRKVEPEAPKKSDGGGCCVIC
ncbi:hypothetical protein ACO0R3_004029 [Hanseniaspora guilliermondii]